MPPRKVSTCFGHGGKDMTQRTTDVSRKNTDLLLGPGRGVRGGRSIQTPSRPIVHSHAGPHDRSVRSHVVRYRRPDATFTGDIERLLDAASHGTRWVRLVRSPLVHDPRSVLPSRRDPSLAVMIRYGLVDAVCRHIDVLVDALLKLSSFSRCLVDTFKF